MNKYLGFLLLLGLIVFSILDNGLPAFFDELSKNLGINKGILVNLISTCSFGIVIGLLFFSGSINKANYGLYLKIAVLLGVLSATHVLNSSSYELYLLSRFFLGLLIGLISSMAWWFSFNLSGNSTSYVVYIMTARPLSIALGVPLLTFFKDYIYWEWLYIGFLGLVVLYLFIPVKKSEEEVKTHIWAVYREIFSNKSAYYFYLTILTNAMGYLGFYVIIPFWENIAIEKLFLFYGLTEITGTLLSKKAIFSKQSPLYISFGILVLMPLIVFFDIHEYVNIAAIALYIFAARVYIVNVANTIPRTFSYLSRKDGLGTCGSLIGVFAWLGLGLISFISSFFLVNKSLSILYIMLLVLNLISVLLFKLKLQRIYYA